MRTRYLEPPSVALDNVTEAAHRLWREVPGLAENNDWWHAGDGVRRWFVTHMGADLARDEDMER